MDREQHSAEGQVRCHDVYDRDTHSQGAPIRVAVDTHHAAVRLQDGVVAGQAAHGTVAAESANGDVDEPGMPCGENLVIAQAPPGHGADLEVLDQSFGVPAQP